MTEYFLRPGYGTASRTMNNQICDYVLSLGEYAGAVFDGATDMSAVLTAAIAAMPAGAALLIPGPIRLNSTVTITKSIKIFQHSRNAAKILTPAGVTAFAIAAGVNGVTFSNVKLESIGGTRTSGSCGVKTLATSPAEASIGYLWVEECDIFGYDIGLSLTWVQLGSIRTNHIWGNNTGLYTRYAVNMTASDNILELNLVWNANIDGAGDPSLIVKSCGFRLIANTMVNGGSASIAESGNLRVAYNENFFDAGGMYDVPVGAKNVRLYNVIRGSFAPSWVGASKSTNVHMSLCEQLQYLGGDNIAAQEYGVALESCSGVRVTHVNFYKNTNFDALVYGTSSYNIFRGNEFRSSNGTASLVETGELHTIALGNTYKKPLQLSSSSVNVDNFLIA